MGTLLFAELSKLSSNPNLKCSLEFRLSKIDQIPHLYHLEINFHSQQRNIPLKRFLRMYDGDTDEYVEKIAKKIRTWFEKDYQAAKFIYYPTKQQDIVGFVEDTMLPKLGITEEEAKQKVAIDFKVSRSGISDLHCLEILFHGPAGTATVTGDIWYHRPNNNHVLELAEEVVELQKRGYRATFNYATHKKR